MDDSVLDELIESDRPALAPRSSELASVLAEISAEPTRRRNRWGIGAVVSLGVILASGTTAAIASPAVREWLGWTPDWTVEYKATTGESCVASFLIDYQQYRTGQARSKDEVYALAVEVTKRTDLSPQGIQHAVDERRAELESSGEDAWAPWLELAPAEFENFAVEQLMVDTLHDAFVANDIFVVGLSVNNECDEATN